MSRANWPNVYASVLGSEGGYWDDPVGGPTLNGVTQSTYDSWRVNNGYAKQTVRLMTEAERTRIYQGGYWKPVRGDELPTGLDLCVFDYAINSGPSQAIKDLQRILNVVVDGAIGAKTIEAVNVAMANGGYTVTIKAYIALRWAFMKKLKNFKPNEDGWRNRLDKVQAEALTMVVTGPFDDAATVADTSVAALAEIPGTPVAPGAAKAMWRDVRAFATAEGQGLAMAFAGLFGSLIPRFKPLSQSVYMMAHGYAYFLLIGGLCMIGWEYFKKRNEKRS